VRFPYGSLVFDRGGRLCRNREATRLIGSLGLAKAELTYCSLLGCRRPDTVLKAACVTDLALAGDAPLPEIRVDVGYGDRRRRAGGVAAAAGCHRRSAQADEPALDGRAAAVDTSLGATGVESAEGPIGGAWLDQRAGQLLKYLIAERRRAVAVDEIGESVSPGADWRERPLLRPRAAPPARAPARFARAPSAFVVARCGTYRLQLDHVDLDAVEFEAYVEAGLTAAAASPQAAAARSSSTSLRSIAAISSPSCCMPSGRRPSAVACTIRPASGCIVWLRSASSCAGSTAPLERSSA
jgi:hypothetical protein